MKTVIKNGLIVDGTGRPGFIGDIVIENDRISEIIYHPSFHSSSYSPSSSLSSSSLSLSPSSLSLSPSSPSLSSDSPSLSPSLSLSQNLSLSTSSLIPDPLDSSLTPHPLDSSLTPDSSSLIPDPLDSSLIPDPLDSSLIPDPLDSSLIPHPLDSSLVSHPLDSSLTPDPSSLVPPTSSLDRVIDATGLIVSPGFIDAHAHSDAYLILEPSAPSKISQGITTEINGQCGGSVAPRYGEARLSSDWAALLGDRLTWRSLADYREALSAAQPAINTVQFVGHNTLRSSVVGYAGRSATSDEMNRMKYLLEQSLDEGGWGLTTGLIYQPGKYATPDEVTTLATVAAKKGGLYATHMRSEGDAILESIDEVIALAQASGIRAEISHLKTSGKKNWSKLEAVLEKIERGMSDGFLIGSDRYPYCAAGTDLDIVLPDWAQEGAAPAETKRLRDPSLRARIIAEMNASDRDWASVMIGGTWSDETKPFSGKTITEILSTRGDSLYLACNQFSSPGELVAFILECDGCKTGAFFFGMSEDNLNQILSRPWIVPGSDASLRAPWGPLGNDHPHPRAYGTMPEFYRRVRALGISREEAVARMTSVPAKRFGIRQRGTLEKGAYADIVIWNEEKFQSTATYKEPHRFAAGIHCVIVNGVVSEKDGPRTGRFLER